MSDVALNISSSRIASALFFRTKIQTADPRPCSAIFSMRHRLFREVQPNHSTRARFRYPRARTRCKEVVLSFQTHETASLPKSRYSPQLVSCGGFRFRPWLPLGSRRLRMFRQTLFLLPYGVSFLGGVVFSIHNVIHIMLHSHFMLAAFSSFVYKCHIESSMILPILKPLNIFTKKVSYKLRG